MLRMATTDFLRLSCCILICISCSCASAADFKFLASKKPYLVGLAGDTFNFDCQTSDASAKVSLWKKIQKSDAGHNIPVGNRVKMSDQVFNISNLTLSDGGIYFCKATDLNGQKIKMTIGILFISQGGSKYPLAHMVSVSKIAEAMSDVNFTCYSFGDGVAHTWFKDGQILPQSQIKSNTSRTKHGLTLQESILLLHRVTPADGGRYVCQVNTLFTQGHKHNATAILQVNAKPLHWNRSTELIKDDFAILYVGDPVEFDCSLTQPWVNVSLWYQETSQYIRIIPDDHIKKIHQKFRIDEIRLTDAGEYQCRAPNIKPPEAVYVQVDTDGIPRPKPSLTYGGSKIHHGSDITLQCNAIGNVILTLIKIDNNGSRTKLKSTKPPIEHLPNGRSKTVTSLTITNFTGSEDGIYRCVLTRNYVTWRSYDDVYLSVKDMVKPTFSSFPSEMSMKEGSYFHFYYATTGSPWPSIAWYKIHDERKEELLVNCDEHVCRKYVDLAGFTVNRNYFSLSRLLYPRDDMVLKCVVKNRAGSTNKTLRVSVKAKPKIVKGRVNVHMSRGSSEEDVVCIVKSANPRNLTYNWEIQHYSDCKVSECKPEDGNWKLLAPSREFRINSNSQNSTLTLVKNKQTVFIRCTAINYLGESNRTWKLIILAPIKVRALNKIVVTDEGTNVRLSCIADVSILAKVMWKRNSVIVSQNTRYSQSENASSDGRILYTLHIKNANITDRGTYQCTVVTSGESVSKKISLTVQEIKVPSVNLRSRVLYNTSSFIIPCNVTGHPRPTITWTKDRKPLSGLPPLSSKKACSSAKPGIYRMSKASGNVNSFLIVCDADFKEHSGLYTCKAINKLGSDSGEAYINITAAPTVSLSKEGYIHDVELETSFSLFCRGEGNPTPRVWWEKKEEGKGYQRLENLRGNVLNFTSFEKGDIGSYQCVAENMFGRKKRPIKIQETVSVKGIHGASAGSDNSKKYTVVIGCVSFVVLAIVIIVAVVLYKRKRAYGGFYILTLPPLTDYIKKLDPGTPLTEQTNRLPYDPQWEFPRNRLKFYRELGAGAFGKVFLAEGLGIVAFDPRGSVKRRSSRRRFGVSARRNHYVNNNKVTKVAVKTLKEDSGQMEHKDLLSELKILIHVGEHRNIVNLLGACTKGRESDLWVIMEYCSNGNLLQFLRNRRDIYEPEWKSVSKDPNNQLTMTDLVIAAYQVARGMEFLASRMCIHRDLATRNILVTENYVIKIADFGLARDVGADSQYVKTSTGLLPIKWMAIEAIIDRIFTEKSDIWSFGIVLWELFTLGGTPYPNVSPNEVSEFLAAGNRMDPPHLCPEEIVSLMLTCWHDDRENRPTFVELVQILDKIIEVNTSFEEGCGYLEVQGDEGTKEYLRPSEVKSPQMDPFECNSPLPPIPSPGDNEGDSLIERDQNARHNKKFNFDKSAKNRGRKDSELEKVRKDGKPENSKESDQESKGSDIDGYIDTSLTGKEKTRIERDLEKDRDSSEEPHVLDDYAYWKKTIV